MTTSKRRSVPVAVLATLALVLSACGGDDDDDAAASVEEDGGDGADAGDTAGDDGDQESIEIDDLGDMPEECVDAMGDFLERIEPIVEDIDFENADLSSFDDIAEQIDAEASAMDDEELEEQCAQYTFGDDGEFEAIKEIARDRAPGVLAFIEFQEQMMEDFADMTIPDISIPDISIPDISIPDITIPDITIPDISTASFADCESAIAYIDELIETETPMMELPISDLSSIGSATTVITSDCSADQVSEFFGRTDVQEFMSG